MAYSDGRFKLIDNAAVTGPAIDWPGGRGVFSVPVGTFTGGVTVKLTWSPDDGENYQDVDRSGDTYVTLTAAGAGLFDLPVCKIKAVVSGGSPAGIYAYATCVP